MFPAVELGFEFPNLLRIPWDSEETRNIKTLRIQKPSPQDVRRNQKYEQRARGQDKGRTSL